MPPIVYILLFTFIAVVIMVLVTQKFPSHLSPEKMGKLWKFTFIGMLTLGVLGLIKMCMGPTTPHPYDNNASSEQMEQHSQPTQHDTHELEQYVPDDADLPSDARVRDL